MTRETKTWKRILGAVMAAALMMSFTACGGGDKEASDPVGEENSATETESTPTPPPAMITVKIATVSNIGSTLNIRSEPNTDCDVLGSAKKGDRFTVLTENCQQGWHEISYNGGKAYVSSDYVQITTEQQPAPTPTPDPNAPIIVNGGGREEDGKDTGSSGMTTESIKETEDPARR